MIVGLVGTMCPGSTMTIYNIPIGIVSNFFPLACTPNNITAGFEKTRIYPINVNIFGEHDFMPAYPTDRPNPEPDPAMESLVLSVNNVTHVDLIISEKDKPESNCSKYLEQYFHISFSDNIDVLSADEPTAILAPKDLRPFKRAEVRKRIFNKKGKKKGSTSILTDSPNMSILKKEKNLQRRKSVAMS